MLFHTLSNQSLGSLISRAATICASTKSEDSFDELRSHGFAMCYSNEMRHDVMLNYSCDFDLSASNWVQEWINTYLVFKFDAVAFSPFVSYCVWKIWRKCCLKK